MRQAIEEGFILDVLKNYTAYKTYYRIIKSIEDDPEVDKKKAARALARFMSLHPHNIAQKTEIMVEHFRRFTSHKIGGKAKAMVVTSSRLHAVRYKQAFDKYISENGYRDIKTLVAFSGTVYDPDINNIKYTEVEMNNGIREKELPEKFSSGEYQVLLVAEKYQTGFDQPLLHTMYIDKRLSGVHAVQTLSRLNRTSPNLGKEETFVLDFVNEPEEIYEAFKPYYEQTSIKEEVDPQQLYILQTQMDEQQIYHHDEVAAFCQVFFKSKENHDQHDHAMLNSFIDPAVKRFKALDENSREDFRHLLLTFRNLYSFLSQIIPFQDSDLEKLYTYVRFLLNKLPRRQNDAKYEFDSEVNLKYYRLQKISEGSIELEPNEAGDVSGPVSVGTGASYGEKIKLSKLIDIVNERFGTEFKPADELFFNQIREEAVADESLRQAALANPIDNFKYVFDKALEDLIIDRMEQNEDIFAKFMNDKDFQKVVSSHLLNEVYDKIHQESRP
jgi:type I restriction enzyme R subunit